MKRNDGGRMLAGRGKFHERVLRNAFIRTFINGPVGVRGNATRAVLHVGMASTLESAKTIGYRLMRDPAMIATLERKLARADATNDRIIQELARIAMSDIREVVEWGPEVDDEGKEIPGSRAPMLRLKSSRTIDDETAAAISEVS